MTLRVCLIALLLLGAVGPIFADRSDIKSPSEELLPSAGVTLTAYDGTDGGTDTYTTTPKQVGLSEFQALDWYITSLSTPSVHVIILQSNYPKGPFAKWSSPDISGSAPTNDVTITTYLDGTHLATTPSIWYVLMFVNTDTGNPVTLRRAGLLKQ